MVSKCTSVSVSKQTVGTRCDRVNALPHRHIQTCKLVRELRENGRKEEGAGGIHIYRAFLAFVPRPNAVTTLS